MKQGENPSQNVIWLNVCLGQGGGLSAFGLAQHREKNGTSCRSAK